jgi:hypothetical protein
MRRRGTEHVARPLRHTTVHLEHLTFSTIVHRSFYLSALAILVTRDDQCMAAYHRRATITGGEPPPIDLTPPPTSIDSGEVGGHVGVADFAGALAADEL